MALADAGGSDNPESILTSSPSTSLPTCASRDTDTSITFTTSFLNSPGAGDCITLSDVFISNTTYNDGGYFEYINSTYGPSGQGHYDPSANYSSVLYTQRSPAAAKGDSDDEKYFAPRTVNFYKGKDCLQGAFDSGTIAPWYRSDCRERNDCEHYPFSIGSFYVFREDGTRKEVQRRLKKKGKCVLAAQYAVGSALRPGLLGVLAGVVSMAIWQLG